MIISCGPSIDSSRRTRSRIWVIRLHLPANTTLSRTKPIVSVSIIYRDRPIRAQVIQPPAVDGGYAISLRFFADLPLEQIKLSYLFGKERHNEGARCKRNAELRDVVATGDIDAAIKFCITHKLNMIVSGGTSTGKTVTARKILSFVQTDERIITIEEAAELRPAQPNVVTLMSDRDSHAQRGCIAYIDPPYAAGPDRLGRSTRQRGHDFPRGHQHRARRLADHTARRNATTGGSAPRNRRPENRFAHDFDMNDYITRSIDVIIQAGRHEGARGITEFYLPIDPAQAKETAHV